MFVPNFMKIESDEDFFVGLAWNDPYGKYLENSLDCDATWQAA